jgi:hypothetical protein
VFSKSKRSASAAKPSRTETDAGLTAFASEAAAPDPPVQEGTSEGATPSPTPISWRAARVANWVAVLALSGSVVAAAGTWEYKRRSAARTAFLSVETSVPGMEVVVGDDSVGRTPVAVWLKPGSYSVRVEHAKQRRDFTVELAAGRSVYRQIDFGTPGPDAAAPNGTAPSEAHLRVDTGSSSMAVVVDGVERGMSPVSVQGLAAGIHDVVVRGAGATLRHKVVLSSRESTVLVFPSAAKPEASGPAAPVSAGAGWLAVTSAVQVQIREDGKVLGSTEADRVMLPTGEHKLEFVNEPLGYLVRRSVRIEPGKTTALQLERVNGVLSINAQPWAEVWVDGERVGETPIGNLSRPIGTHEVVLRHPQLGEHRALVTLTTRQPARLGVDLRKK